MEIRNTRDVHLDGVKILVYGDSGAGKTTLMGGLDSPLILSAESGLLALQGKNVPYVVIKSLEDLREAYNFVVSEDGKIYKTICLDSISEIAEVILNLEKKRAKDPRQAYGAMNETVNELVRAFRDMPGKNVVFSAKIEKSVDEEGKVFYGPGMPGKTLSQGLAFFFDEVFALRVEKNADGETVRALLTGYTGLWSAKDRSGKLDLWEPADLGKIIEKIQK